MNNFVDREFHRTCPFVIEFSDTRSVQACSLRIGPAAGTYGLGYSGRADLTGNSDASLLRSWHRRAPYRSPWLPRRAASGRSQCLSESKRRVETGEGGGPRLWGPNHCASKVRSPKSHQVTEPIVPFPRESSAVSAPS